MLGVVLRVWNISVSRKDEDVYNILVSDILD